MSELVEEVELRNLHSDQYDVALLVMGMDDHHLENVRQTWVPQLQDPVTEIRNRHTDGTGQLDKQAAYNEVVALDLQDSHWDWDKKWNELGNDISKVFFVVECNGATQAMMIVDNSTYRCRHEDAAGNNLIYVEYVAVAPWNRRSLVADPIYKGIGKILVGTAISLSIEEEFDGRIGLHSLPQADGFYTSCGMTDFGPDGKKQNMRYFEMTTKQANEFLNTD